MKTAFLFGPFIGSLNYELYQFAPHAIYMKKKFPESTLILFTRPNRLDLYGQYVDIFVPMRLDHDDEKNNFGFTSHSFSSESYDVLVSAIRRKFIPRYNKLNHIYPNINRFMKKVRWQFPKDKMDYDYKPRESNKKIVDEVTSNENFILTDYGIETSVDSSSCGLLELEFEKRRVGSSSSKLGCLIELIKKCKIFVGDISSPSTRLAFLMKKPIITTEDVSGDGISLINPFRCPVIKCNEIEKGVQVYHENYI